MKVAFISYDWGEYCIRLAGGLAQEAPVHLMLANQLATPHLHRLDARIQFQPFHKPRLRQPTPQLRTIYQLLRSIRDFEPDIIHIQQGHLWFNLALPFLRRYPVVITIHDPRHHMGDKGAHNTPQPIFDFGFRRATQIIVHTSQMAQVVVDEIGISREIIHVIPHILLGDATEQIEIEEDENLVLYFGRIWAYKGIEYLLRAEPLITQRIPTAKIVIAGEGDDFAPYRRMMVNPDKFIIHNEYVSNEKRTELFRRASLVAMPYVEATQSGVVPIAYTFGKPVVATEVGGLPEQVDHGQTGLLVPPRDERALAEAIIQLLEDKDLRYQMGANAQRKLHREWSAQVIAQRTLTVYELALQRFANNDRYDSRQSVRSSKVT